MAGTNWSQPSFVTISMFDELQDIWDADSDDLGALALGNSGGGAGSASRVAAAWTAATSFDVALDFNDGAAHRVSMYFFDHGTKGRTQRIDVIDGDTGDVLVQHQLTDFGRGRYITWDLSGNVRIRITNTGGGPDAVLGGIFFDQAAPPAPPAPSMPAWTLCLTRRTVANNSRRRRCKRDALEILPRATTITARRPQPRPASDKRALGGGRKLIVGRWSGR